MFLPMSRAKNSPRCLSRLGSRGTTSSVTGISSMSNDSRDDNPPKRGPLPCISCRPGMKLRS
eukprot:scaffold10736_cov42-Prasinocladus_malaysianus.AAC.1